MDIISDSTNDLKASLKPPSEITIPGANITALIFDTKDIERFAELGIPQLRKEINYSHHRQDYHFDCHDTNNEVIERDYQAACQAAINKILSRQPKTIVTNSRHIDVDRLKYSIDIVTVIERYTHLIKAGKNFKALCPFHSEKSPSFTVYPDKNTWHCFGACNTGGDAISFVMKAENCDFKSAIAILGGTTC